MKQVEQSGDLDDPYGATIEGIRNAIRWGLEHDGGMSQDEFQILIAIEEFVRQQDNA